MVADQQLIDQAVVCQSCGRTNPVLEAEDLTEQGIDLFVEDGEIVTRYHESEMSGFSSGEWIICGSCRTPYRPWQMAACTPPTQGMLERARELYVGENEGDMYDVSFYETRKLTYTVRANDPEQAEEIALLVYGDAERYWSDIDTDTHTTEVRKSGDD